MSRFSRSSSWLRTVFPSSEAPIEDIGDLSDTVFLTHPYLDPLGVRTPNGWFSQVGPFTLAAGTNNLDAGSINAGEVVRLLGVSYLFTVGPTSNTRLYLFASSVAGDVPDAGLYGPLAEHIDSGTTFATGVFRLTSPVIGGGHNLVIRTEGATLNNILRIKFYFVAAPVGTIFYV